MNGAPEESVISGRLLGDPASLTPPFFATYLLTLR